jgi:hypothetical protein
LIQVNAAAEPAWLHRQRFENIEAPAMITAQRLATIRTGVIAGAAGGLAEIAWVTIYAGMTGADPAILARGVTTAAGVGASLPASPVPLGIAVHMMLAVLLGTVLACAWQALAAHRPGLTNPYPFMLVVLAGVWAVNFFVVLPIVSPAFTHLLPYAVSLTSKLLFGVAAAEVVRDDAIFAARETALASGDRR